MQNTNTKYWSFWAYRLTLDSFPFLLFCSFSSSFFFIHVAVSWIFALCVSTLLSTLKTCHLLSALKNAFDLCVIISIVLERFMKIMTGSRAHWYSNMSSLLVTWTICHFMKPVSIIQSNYNSFWDYAIFTRLFYGLILTSKTAAFFVVFILCFITDKAISWDNNHSYSSDISILRMTLMDNWCKSQYNQICIRRNKCLFFMKLFWRLGVLYYGWCDAFAS